MRICIYRLCHLNLAWLQLHASFIFYLPLKMMNFDKKNKLIMMQVGRILISLGSIFDLFAMLT
jgi:hypothetical protein